MEHSDEDRQLAKEMAADFFAVSPYVAHLLAKATYALLHEIIFEEFGYDIDVFDDDDVEELVQAWGDKTKGAFGCWRRPVCQAFAEQVIHNGWVEECGIPESVLREWCV